MILRKYASKDVYQFLRKAYITAFIAAVLTRVLLPIALAETQAVNTLVFSAVAVFGASIICFDFFTRRIFLKQKNVVWLVLFLAACAVSSLINARFGVLGNVRNLVWLAISFFLLYPLDAELSRAEVKSEIKYVSNILILVWFVACTASLAMFLFQIGDYVDVSPDLFARFGFIEGRLFGIFEDPNFAASVAIVVIIFSIFNIKNSERAALKAFYWLSIAVNFCYITLSGSRTSEVAAAVTVIFGVYFVLLKNFEVKSVRLNLIVKQFVLAAISLICGLAVFLSVNIARKGLSYLPQFVSSPFEQASVSDARLRKHIDMNREDVVNSSDVSNCRFKIWESAWELFLSAPVFGTSPRNMRTYAKELFPNGFIAQRAYAVHNAYLDIFASTGVVGAFFLIVFFVKYLIFVFTHLFFAPAGEDYYMVLLSFTVVVAVAVSAFFLSEIFFVNTINVLTFWLCMGYSGYFAKAEVSKLAAGSRIKENDNL